MKNEISVKVCVLVVNRRGDLLLLKEKYPKLNEYLLNVIKGSVADREPETIYEAAVREAYEEASVRIIIKNVLGFYSVVKEGSYKIYVGIIAESFSKNPRVGTVKLQKKLNESIESVKWYAKDDIKKLTKQDFISEIVYKFVQDWLSGKKFPIDVIK